MRTPDVTRQARTGPQCSFCGYPIVGEPLVAEVGGQPTGDGSEPDDSADGLSADGTAVEPGPHAGDGTPAAGSGWSGVDTRGSGAASGASDPRPPRFCTAACRDAYSEGETPFIGRHGYEHSRTGVAVLDQLLPRGFRSDSFVICRGQEGTRRSELMVELAWRALQRDEPVVFVSFVDPPGAVVESFLALGWNVLPYLERGDLRIVDCFTRRLSNPDQFSESRNRWHRHLARTVADATTEIRNPDDVRELEGRLTSAVEDEAMTDRGTVVLDSLEEMGTLVSDVQVENFLKELRAEVCKNRYVPVFASRCADRSMDATQQRTRVSGGGIATDLTYFADGVIDLRLDGQFFPDARLKQLSVREMDGVPYVPQWLTYELDVDGLRSFDPATETAATYDPRRLAAWNERGAGGVGRTQTPQSGGRSGPQVESRQETGRGPTVQSGRPPVDTGASSAGGVPDSAAPTGGGSRSAVRGFTVDEQ